MNLYRRLFPKAAELQAAQSKVEKLEASFAELNRRHTTLWESYNKLDAEVQSKRNELAEMRGKLREQVDADLLLVSARIILATLKGEKPNPEDLIRQQQLGAMQNSLRAQMGYYESASPIGLLQGLGLGGVFGR